MKHAPEVREGAALVVRTTDMLLATSTEQKGRSASDLRRACGDMKTNAEHYIFDNVIADKLSECFVLARTTGATLGEFNRIEEAVWLEAPISPIAQLMKNVCLNFTLQQMAMALIDIDFVSREDVEFTNSEISNAYYEVAEAAADSMDSPSYRAVVALHAAVVSHLYETARPLPRMLAYEFAKGRPTLVLSHRLYDTASRADELRKENKIVHPAFAPRSGRALGSV